MLTRCALLGLFLIAPLPAIAAELLFVATLDSDQVDCTGGPPGFPGATGNATLLLDTVSGTVDFFIVYTGLSSTLAAAHVHGPAPACGGASVVYDLPLDDPIVGLVTLTPAQVADMLGSLHFIVFHTTQFFVAEIRGQVVPADQQVPFRRGDCSADAAIDIADAVRILSFLFLGGETMLCADACDINDDDSINIADAIYLLSALFLGGPPPPPPGLDCGEEGTMDSLSCLASPCL